MEKFDLNRILEFYKPDFDTVAKILFPHNGFPQAALRRVLTGPATLDANQIAALAKYLGVLVGDLYTVDSNWKGTFKNGYLSFIKDDYKAVLNYKGSFISVYKNNTLIAQKLIATSMTLENFYIFINNLIKNNHDRDYSKGTA